MPLYILGLNHSTAPVEIREQVVFAGNDMQNALADILALDGVREAVILSTCNRTEIYAAAEESGAERLRAWLIEDRKLGPHAAGALFSRAGEDAIRHLFRVACGLDSMVLGEPQVLGQLKEAYRQAELAEAVGAAHRRLFQHTFSVAKKVRSDTEIGCGPVSVAYAAVTLAGQFFAGFPQHTALLIGAGATVELVAQHLRGRGIGRLFIANRNVSAARELAARFGGYAVPLSELDGMLPDADILISSTASRQPIVSLEQMQRAVRARRRRPVFAVDIAVPRDIEPAVSTLDDIYLYTIDDLEKVVLEGQSNHQAAVADAERILADETRRYLDMERGKQVAPVITALRDHGDALRHEVMERARRRLARGQATDDVLEYALGSLLKKLLHEPSARLRAAGESGDDGLIEAARELFDLGRGKPGGGEPE